MRCRRWFVYIVGLPCLVTAGAGDATLAPAPAVRALSLNSSVVLSGNRSASVDVVLTRPVSLPPTYLFDPPANVFDANRVGAGFALISLEYAVYPPSLVGMVAPQGSRVRRLQFPFGDDRAGHEILETLRLPAGRYRLYLYTPGGATTVRFRLPGLPSGTSTVVPTRPEAVVLQRRNAEPVTVTGSILGDTRTTTASQTLVVKTAAALLEVAPRGYESWWCLYRNGPPPTGYLPRCLTADIGFGTGNGLPAIGYDLAGYSAFVGVPPGRWAVSRSVDAVGKVVDQTSYFIWIPMPLAAPASAGTSGPRVAAADVTWRRSHG